MLESVDNVANHGQLLFGSDGPARVDMNTNGGTVRKMAEAVPEQWVTEWMW